MKARAVVFTDRNTVSFQEVDCPDPAADQVVVRVTHSWISNGTEGSYLRGERVDGDTPWRPGDPHPFPIVAGYQKVGIVEWVGAEVDDLKVGDRVFASIGKIDGMFEPRGGHISPSVCPRAAVLKLPEGVDPLAFSGLVLTQVGYNSGVRPQLKLGDGAIVVGDGLVGQWTAQMLASRGAKVVLVGRHADRLAYFKQGETLLEDGGKWVEKVAEMFPEGAQVAVDTVGSIELMDTLQGLLRRFAHLVSAGFYGPEDRLELQPPRYKELSIDLVSGATPERLEETLKLVANGTLDTLSLITHRFPVEQAAEAWKLIETKKEPVMGVILDWETTAQ
ncbi:zinc-binding dehydrogenase [Pelagicoccus sp. SDUM812002]|uniref:zinc-binding dehydrogenase n=1 Tax=Pelagicoccus sp. SDUM812002 TaxID=3041266 RepID=UPI00280FC9B1|nr:zinc-binding dehydrogenase [Pelagicoccus sp. SDUM812002]MDQ8188413.1 zinc-binding dehydrogenase [Pelagicoccus sp. SDUM812002]